MLPRQASSMVLRWLLIGKRLPGNAETHGENQCHGAQCIVIPPFGRAACGNNERRDEVASLSRNEQNEQNPKAAFLSFLQWAPDQGDNGNVKSNQPNPSQNVMELGVIRPTRLIKMPRQCVGITKDLKDTSQGNKPGGVPEVYGRNISRKVGFMNMWSGSTCS